MTKIALKIVSSISNRGELEFKEEEISAKKGHYGRRASGTSREKWKVWNLKRNTLYSVLYQQYLFVAILLEIDDSYRTKNIPLIQ